MVLALLGACLPVAHGAVDLRITSITRDGDCTTLTWVSQPREFYTVFSTDSLVPPVAWQVAAVNVSSGGDTTTWSVGCESQNSMMNSLLLAAQSQPLVLSEEELTARVAGSLAASSNAVAFLMAKLQEATERAAMANFTDGLFEVAQFNTENVNWPFDPPENPPPGTNYPTTAKFFHVARTLPEGFVDGWGSDLAAIPAGLTNIIAVAAGLHDSGTHNLALRADGSVVAWGANFWGQTNVPTNLTNVVAIAVGGRHSAAVKRDGTLVLWGNNSFGQITNAPAGLTNVVDVKAGLWHTLVLRSDGTVAAWGDLFNRSNAVPTGLTNITAISAGPRHCLALRSNGTVIAWGFTYDFLGNFLPTNVPSGLSNVVAISAGMEHNQALLADGSVAVWGRTNNVAVSNFPAPTNIVAISAGWNYGTALADDTSVIGWGHTVADTGRDGIVALSAGAMHVLVVRINDESPVITIPPRNVLEPVGTTTNISVVATSTLPVSFQWQKNGVDIQGATSNRLELVNLQETDEGLYRVRVSNARRSLFSEAVTVTAIQPPEITNQSPALSLLVTQDTVLTFSVGVRSKGWPTPSYRWEKDGTLYPPWMFSFSPSRMLVLSSVEQEGGYRVIVSNPAGSVTSAVWQVKIRLRGEATAWGDNSFGQLDSSRGETNLVAIAAGADHTVGLRENGTVVQWGYVATNVPAGLSNVVAVSAGYDHSLALREDGTVVAWGEAAASANFVPTNLPPATAIAAGWNHNLALHTNGTVTVWGVNGSGLGWNLLQIPSGISNATFIAAGALHSLVLRADGTVVSWGYNADGQTNVPAGLTNAVAVAGGGMHSLALRADGTITAWGANGYGQCDVPSGLSNVLAISAGFEHSLVLKNDGKVVAWGRNNHGQATIPEGLGDTYMIAAGMSHSVAIAYEKLLNYPVDVPRDLLVIYNTNCVESADVKNYYLANRPHIANVNVLGVGGAATNAEDYLTSDEMTNTLVAPVNAWLAANPTKRPSHYVLCFGIPNRTSTYPLGGGGALFANAVALRGAVLGRPPYITSLNMETTNDCYAYIDKLAQMGTNLPVNTVVLSRSRISALSGTYVLDNVTDSEFPRPADHAPARLARDLLLALDVLTQSVRYADNYAAEHGDTWPYTLSDHVTNATNVAAYMCWGTHGYWPWNWPMAGLVTFHGQSDWYIIQSVESWNGRWKSALAGWIGQPSYQEWFYENVFGGTNYSCAAVGAVSHVMEPYLDGVNDTKIYFVDWNRGKYFSIAAWHSRGSPYMQATGDPFTIR
jgi:alpha-tubulin suppressor-like RCC1 family protein